MSNPIKSNIQLLIGCIIYVLGINLFLVPSGIFTTGLMGLAQEFAQTINLLFDMSLNNNDKTYLLIQTIAYWAMNIPIIIFGYSKLGKRFIIRTLIVSSVVIQILVNTIVIDHNIITDLDNTVTLASTLLSLGVGSILIGVGLGLIIKNDASSGGTDIIAMYLSIYKGKSFGAFNLLLNMIVVVWSILLTSDITGGILILISLYIQSAVVDFVYNYNQKVTMLIVTKKPHEIGKCILDTGRTYTQMHGQQGYSKNEIELLIAVVNSEEVKYQIDLMRKIDDDVFIDVVRTTSLSGNFVNRYTMKSGMN